MQKKWVTILLAAGLLIAITLFSVSVYYLNNWTNQLTCEISDVTPVDSIASGGSIRWFFQYNYRAVGCDSFETFTIKASSYSTAYQSWEEISNRSTTNCYAYKGTDQCSVSMYNSFSSAWLGGIVIGFFGILICGYLLIDLILDRH